MTKNAVKLLSYSYGAGHLLNASRARRTGPGSSISRSWAARQTTIHLKIVGVS